MSLKTLDTVFSVFGFFMGLVKYWELRRGTFVVHLVRTSLCTTPFLPLPLPRSSVLPSPPAPPSFFFAPFNDGARETDFVIIFGGNRNRRLYISNGTENVGRTRQVPGTPATVVTRGLASRIITLRDCCINLSEDCD